MAKKPQFVDPIFGAPPPSSPPSAPATPYQPTEGAPTSRAQAVLRKHRERLMAIPGMRWVATQLGSDPPGEEVILAAVASRSVSDLVPDQLDGVKVVKRIFEQQVDAQPG